MEILSLEERAKSYAEKINNCNGCSCKNIYCYCRQYEIAYDNFIDITTEERERCIKLAQDVHCKMCELEDYCKIHGGEEDFECDSRDRIRKAIEEGNKE